jgi:hypothetical protein
MVNIVTTRRPGDSASNAIPVGQTPRIVDSLAGKATAEQYCNAIEAYIKREITEHVMWQLLR